MNNIKMIIFVVWGLSWILSGFGVFFIIEAISNNCNWFVILLSIIYSLGGFYLAIKLELNSKEESNDRCY